MMDHEIRVSGLAGNYCALVFELDGIPDANILKQKCEQFFRRFPQSCARIRKVGRQFEWHQNENGTIAFYQHYKSQIESETIINVLNKSMPLSESVPLEFHLISGQSTSQFIMRWFHPVCDAKGAELILHHLFNEEEAQEEGKEKDEEAELNHKDSAINQLLEQSSLWQKLKFGYRSKKNIDKLDKLSSVLPPTSVNKPNFVNTKVIRFDQAQSQQVLKLARQCAGISGISLYFIGCMMRALQHSNKLDEGDAYCVPYALNLRKRKSLFPIFGNQVSFLFAQASKQIVDDRQALFSHLREQNKAAIKQNLDRAMLPLMQAGGWLNLEKYGQIVRRSPQGRERSSFWFSYTGSMDPEPKFIGECPITNMFQFSLVTTPPSLGLLVNHFQGSIILSYNYVENQFEPSWTNQLLDTLKSELLGVE